MHKVLLTLGILLPVLFPLGANAQQKPGSISISPALTKITLQKNQSRQTASITIKNNYPTDLAFSAEVTPVDDARGTFTPKLSGANPLLQSVSVSPSTFDLSAGKSINLEITISDNSNLPPGGSYAAIIIQQKLAPTENVGVQAALSAGIFIIKEDGAIRNISATKPIVSPVRFALPSTIETTFHNDGNVQLIPRASATFTTGDVAIGKAIFNTESAPIMPGKSLRLKAPVTKLSSPLLPRRVNVVTYPRYDDALTDNAPLITRFWYIPVPFLALTLALMSTLAFVEFRYKLSTRCLRYLRRLKKH